MNKSTLKFDSPEETVANPVPAVKENKDVYVVVADYLEDGGVGYKKGENVPLYADAAKFHLDNGSVKKA